MKPSFKHIVYCTYYNFVCAGIKAGHPAHQSDTDSTHFSFAVYGVQPEDFANAIEELVKINSSHELYEEYKEIVLKVPNNYDTIRICMYSGNVSITRGNLKVLFYGHISALSGLPKAIRKAIQQRDRKEEE